jgi:drug/metabolite transporter (DMT)-like permease
VPSLALVYGAVFLDERISALALVGLALVLSGVALGTRRSRPAAEVASGA